MLLLTIGIILLGLAGMGVSHFWQKSMEAMMARMEKDNDKFRELIKDIQTDQEAHIETLINFIDKNINERVVYTTKDMGYDNVAKLDKDIIDDEEELLDESQEIDASQLEDSTKLEPIK